MPRKNRTDELPIEFCWATFCKAVLDKKAEKTLYGVMPSLRIEIGIGAEESGKEGSPEKILIPLGDISVYALFKRRPGFDGPLSVPIQFETSGPNFLERPELKVVMSEQNIHSQQVLNFMQANIEVPTKKGRHRKDMVLTFKSGNIELGKVELNLDITVIHQQP